MFSRISKTRKTADVYNKRICTMQGTIHRIFIEERGEEASIIGARVGGVENVKPTIMLIEQIVSDVTETGSAPGTRERTHHPINSRGEENFIEERPEEEDIIIEEEGEIIQL